jgi:4a-hydroxytetrahydrobiopterin dehydratase
MTLAQERAAPIAADTKPLSRSEAEKLAKQIPGWTVKDCALEREFKFKDFPEAMEFVNEIAAVARKQDHHPDICVSYNKVRLQLSTHKIGGLSRNDFILAAHVDLVA